MSSLYLHREKHLSPWKLGTGFCFLLQLFQFQSIGWEQKRYVQKCDSTHLTSPQICHVRGRRDRQNREFLEKAHLWRENKTLWPFLWSSIFNKIWLLNIRGTTDGKIIRLMFLLRIASKIVTLSWHLVTDKKNLICWRNSITTNYSCTFRKKMTYHQLDFLPWKKHAN